MNLQVIFRSNSRAPEPNSSLSHLGVTKSQLSLRSLRSLMTSMEILGQNHLVSGMTLTILDDHSEPEHLDQIFSMTHRSPLNPHLVSLNGEGSTAHLLESLEYAESQGTELIYFVDDTQLHAPNALSQMLIAGEYTTKIFGYTPFLIPFDTIPRSKDLLKRIVLVCGERYWALTPYQPCSMMVTRGAFNQFKDFLIESAEKSTKEPLGIPAPDSELQTKLAMIPCFSPMPGLSVDLSKGAPPPQFISWKTWWESASTTPYRSDTSENASVVESKRLPPNHDSHPPLTPSQILAGHDLSRFLSTQTVNR